MPKETKRRSGGHEKSAKLSKRKSAVQDHSVEYMEVSREGEPSMNEVLHPGAEEEESIQRPLKKKEKQALKHELFIQRLESSRSPYSKSHERRLKRKAREQVAGGLGEIEAAIAVVEDDIPVAVQNSIEEPDDQAAQGRPPKPKPGQIGEGKAAPLSKAQRKRALQAERLRIPMILSNPEFASNPFQTIRTHSQNTLVKHQVPE